MGVSIGRRCSPDHKARTVQEAEEKSKQAKKMGAIWKMMDSQERMPCASRSQLRLKFCRWQLRKLRKGYVWADKPTKEKLNVKRENYLHWATRKYLVDNQHPFADVWSTAGIANSIDDGELFMHESSV